MFENINRDFLKLLGWEGEQLEAFLPDWLQAAEFMGLSDEDMGYALEKWLPQYWNLSLVSVRKMIAACIRETVELAKIEERKSEGKKILYSNTTSSYICIYANKLAGGENLQIAYPDFIMSTVWQAFFGKSKTVDANTPYMRDACGHCALNCIRTRLRTGGRVPSPTVTWNWGLHCNEAPKTEELIDCLGRSGDNVDVLTAIPHDAPLGTVEAQDEFRVAFLAKQIRAGQMRISQLTGIEVSDEHMRASMELYLGYMSRLETLTNLVVNADPQPISGNELALFSICMQVCFNTGVDYVNDALDTALQEVEDRIRLGTAQLPKGSPKLACHFVPLNVPWVDKAFRDNGVNLSLGRVFPQASWMREALTDEDMYVNVARQCLMCPDAINMKDAAAITIRLLKQYDFDGALFGFYDADRWIGALHKTMIRLVEESTGIPHYYLEGDFWDSNRYSVNDRISIIRSICNCLKISRL